MRPKAQPTTHTHTHTHTNSTTPATRARDAFNKGGGTPSPSRRPHNNPHPSPSREPVRNVFDVMPYEMASQHNHFSVGGNGMVHVFHHGFCCVRVRIIGLRLRYCARFLTEIEIYIRGCHWFPRLFSA
jgi:hypothetical protein